LIQPIDELAAPQAQVSQAVFVHLAQLAGGFATPQPLSPARAGLAQALCEALPQRRNGLGLGHGSLPVQAFVGVWCRHRASKG